MEKITEYLKDKYGPWGWMGQRAHDAAGINSILPLDFIISCDYGTDVPHYFREDDVFSIEKHCKVRKDWSNEDLGASLRGALGREIFERWNGYGRQVNLLCYRSVKRLENDVGHLLQKPRIYAMPERLKKRFDNKILLHRNLERLSLTKIPGKIDKLGKNTFNSLRRELALPFVIQFPYGSSGNFTFIIRQEKEYNRIRKMYPDSTVVIRKYIDGFSMNVNAAIVSTQDGTRTVCTVPSVQIAGAPECSNFPSAFCGNDYAAAQDLDRGIIKQVEEHIRVIGKWMAESGFRGVFGMDFVTEKGTVYPVEINPRFQNSTSIYTVLKSMSRPREEALFLLHIAEFLQKEDKRMRAYVRDFPARELMRPVNGSQIILHNRRQRNVVTGALDAGVYRMEGGKLIFIKEGATLDRCAGDDILVTCGVPKPYTVIEPNAPICKIQMRGNALNTANKRKLSGEAKKIVGCIYRKLALEDADKPEMAGAKREGTA
ncbi:MAG: ATP-grasp domain-containing protein [Candidatus Omnitrophota bacterium]